MHNIEKLPRLLINFLPTPLAEMKQLSGFLNGPRILIKRDDLTGTGLGGNKTRKLEFLLGEAREQGCDTVITGGAMQSNHCRQTAACAAVAGFECHLALGGEQPNVPEGNLLLDYLFGAIVHWCGSNRKGETIPVVAEELRRKGKKPYIIPYGGSNVTGAIGFIAAMLELKEQLSASDIGIDYIVFPSSSGGTQVGMEIGKGLSGLSAQVLGIAIDRENNSEPAFAVHLAMLANQIASTLEIEKEYTSKDFMVAYDYFGKGYGIIGEPEREAINLVARHEGLILDPVYTGRAMAGLIDMIRSHTFHPKETVLFWHTGGTPALFNYAAELYSKK